MFLERKFLSDRERRDRRGADGGDELRALPDAVRDVVVNHGRLLAAERGVAHVLPDFGLSRSGHWSTEGLVTHRTRELREVLPRYEPRLAVEDIEVEVDEDGHPALLVSGRVAGAAGLVTLTIDPVARCVCGVRIADGGARSV